MPELGLLSFGSRVILGGSGGGGAAGEKTMGAGCRGARSALWPPHASSLVPSRGEPPLGAAGGRPGQLCERHAEVLVPQGPGCLLGAQKELHPGTGRASLHNLLCKPEGQGPGPSRAGSDKPASLIRSEECTGRDTWEVRGGAQVDRPVPSDPARSAVFGR